MKCEVAALKAETFLPGFRISDERMGNGCMGREIVSRGGEYLTEQVFRNCYQRGTGTSCYRRFKITVIRDKSVPLKYKSAKLVL